jgi:hypothetical protein
LCDRKLHAAHFSSFCHDFTLYFTPYFTLLFALQGLAMNFDWYQERTKDESSTIGGWATALAYDFDMPGGYPAGVEVDWVSGGFFSLSILGRNPILEHVFTS